ncbi:MAG: DNA translocase FtsK 4TM domain-containing protein [Pseudomonadota bacterium]
MAMARASGPGRSARKTRGGRRARKKDARPRLLEEQTETALRRRLVEGLGLVFALLGLCALVILWSYDPRDPSLFSATDAAPRNAFGLVGATVADTLHRALGWAAYGIPLALLVWGGRLILHRGSERIVTRLVVAPIAICVAAVFASAHVPLAGWGHPYGLGGTFGDSMLISVIVAIPVPARFAIVTATLGMGVLFLLLSAVSLGINLPEARGIARFLGQGLRTAGGSLRRGAGIAARAGAAGAGRARSLRARAGGAVPDTPAEPVLKRGAGASAAHPAPETATAPRTGVDEDRVMARISAALARRGTADQAAEAVPEEGAILPDASAPPPKAEPLVRQPDRKPAAKSTRAKAEEQPRLALETPETSATYEAPALSLLTSPTTIVRQQLSNEALEQNARMLETVLDDYGVRGEIVSVRPGPVVTMYELEPAAGLKASRVIGLADDIARSMSALAARVSTIPGRSVIGIELPNETREKVLLRELLSGKAYGDGRHALPLALGKDIAGEPVIANLARMPHLLIAGTTGSGKSVSVNTMILSLLYKLSPEECRLIMIDPKMLELSVYDGIPHLLSPVVTDPKKAVVALKWVVAEMEERYRKMSKMGVRNIDGYNARVQEALDKGEGFTRTVQTGFDDATGEPVFETEEYAPEKMAYIVVIVDEMADLMMVAGKEIEACIQRLAQMARASGIHLIMATQRPSVDVITGTIKANFPTRISFQVTSKIDSRTILGEQGAEQLLGMGDMLYMAGGGRITRVHGPFVSDEEVEEVVRHLKALGAPDYVSGVVDGPEGETESQIDQVLGLGGNTTGEDALYDQAVAIVARDRKCSTSYIQRKLGIGYNKAARLVEQMEDEGIVSASNHVGKREVLVPEP